MTDEQRKRLRTLDAKRLNESEFEILDSALRGDYISPALEEVARKHGVDLAPAS